MSWRVRNHAACSSAGIHQPVLLAMGSGAHCELQHPELPHHVCSVYLGNAIGVIRRQEKMFSFYSHGRISIGNVCFSFDALQAQFKLPNPDRIMECYRSDVFKVTLLSIQESPVATEFNHGKIFSLLLCNYAHEFGVSQDLKFHCETLHILLWLLHAQIHELGILSYFMHQDRITEVTVCGTGPIYTEEDGRLAASGLCFDSNEAVVAIAERIAEFNGRKWDESTPLCDTRLLDGSRVNLVASSLSCDGPAITIRKFPAHRPSLVDLIQMGFLTQCAADMIGTFVKSKKNIVISGGTGTGKTTLLNAIAAFIPEYERIITIEDTAELRLQQSHVIRLEARAPNSENRGLVSIHQLLKNALRMRPDRIIVGECRGPEALDMLQSMNTGHGGGLTTLHANSPLDAIRRLETLCMAHESRVPLSCIQAQIQSTLNIFIQIGKDLSGRRYVLSICSQDSHTGALSAMCLGAAS